MEEFLVKFGLQLLVLVASIFGSYEWGHSNGATSGYKDGVDSQAPALAGLTRTINEYRAAEAKKASAVSSDASNAVVASVKEQAVKETVRTQIVDHYIHDTPTASNCTIDIPTVTAINQILSTQELYK